MKKPLRNYLSVTKKDWNGMVVLVVLIAIVLAAPSVYQFFHKDSTINQKDVDRAMSVLSRAKFDTIASGKDGQRSAHPILFDFNPNNLPADKWKLLGLTDHQIKIIKNYEVKGGRFYKNTDLQKIYSITAEDYKRLEPYIDIPEKEYTAPKLKPGAFIEVNGADSTKLTRVRGVGPGFAMRIIRYRDRLGGFYHKEQLMEVFGVDTAKYHEIEGQLTVDPAKVVKLNINTISFASLRQFPYLNYKQANAIIQYRAQHGNYNSIADVGSVAIITPDVLHKIEPYLSYK